MWETEEKVKDCNNFGFSGQTGSNLPAMLSGFWLRMNPSPNTSDRDGICYLPRSTAK
jgi:hypothetical protein